MGRSKLSNIERRHKARSSVQSKLLNMEHTTSQNWPDLKVPTIALGTWKSSQEQTKQAIVTAVKAGFRFLDTANDYDNEHFIGDALEELFKEGVVKREDLFIQSKLWNSNHRPEHVRPQGQLHRQLRHSLAHGSPKQGGQGCSQAGWMLSSSPFKGNSFPPGRRGLLLR